MQDVTKPKSKISKLYKALEEPYNRVKKKIYPILNITHFVYRLNELLNEKDVLTQLHVKQLELLLEKIDNLIKLDIAQPADVQRLMEVQGILASLLYPETELEQI